MASQVDRPTKLPNCFVPLPYSPSEPMPAKAPAVQVPRRSKKVSLACTPRLEWRRHRLQRCRRFHQPDVPAAGDQLQADRRHELAALQPAQLRHVGKRHIGFIDREAAGHVAELEAVAEGHRQQRCALDRDAGATQIEAVVEAAQAAVAAIGRAIDLEAPADRRGQPRFAEVQQGQVAALQPGLARSMEVQTVPVLPVDAADRGFGACALG